MPASSKPPVAPGQFRAACRRLRHGLDLSAANNEVLTRGVAVAMPAHYAMPFPADVRETFARDGHPPPTRNRRGQYHELVQHLTDLHYLERRVFIAWHRRRERNEAPTAAQLGRIHDAVRTYWAEDNFPLRARLSPPPPGFVEMTDWLERHLPVVVHRLARFVSFDGELDPPPDYRIGELSCYGRSLAFRIRTLFFLDRDNIGGTAYFDRSMLPHLHALNASLGGGLAAVLPGRNATTLDAAVQQLLLNWDRLFAAFRRANRFVDDDDGDGRRPYYLVYDLDENVPADELALGGRRRDERRRQRLERRVRRRLARAPLHADSGENHLGVRLVQIALWRAGFYTGAVDGEFGALSHAALVQLLEQEREEPSAGMRPRRLERALLNAAGTTWVVDLKTLGRILDAYAPGDEAQAEAEERALWAGIAAERPGEDWEVELLERQQEVSSRYPPLADRPRRRVYYGLRGLLRGAWRALRRVVRWVVHKIGEVAGAVFNFVKAVIKRIQEGIGLFFEGFRYFAHYVLGRPFVTTGRAGADGTAPLLATGVRIDFDATNLINAAAIDEDLARHRAYLVRMREGLDFFLDVVTTALRLLGELTTPLGWVRIGVFVARLVRDILRGEPPRLPALA